MNKFFALLTALVIVSSAIAQSATMSARKELSPEVQAEVKRLSSIGDAAAKAGKYSEAIATYWKAWDLLPESKREGDAGLWLLAAIGDANFLNRDYVACRDNLSTAMHIRGAIGNPFLHLRLGQCQYELGNMNRAADELARSYLLEGKKIFKNDAPKYLVFIKSKLKPPPGGWPEGW